MVLVTQDPSSLGQGISALGQALGSGIERRSQRQAQQQQQEQQLAMLAQMFPQYFGASAQNEDVDNVTAPQSMQTARGQEMPDEVAQGVLMSVLGQGNPALQKFGSALTQSGIQSSAEERKANLKQELSRAEPVIQKFEKERDNLARRKQALEAMQSAIESGEVGRASPAFLAEKLGIPQFQNMSGAQLQSAIKEELFGTISQLGGRPNTWIEQQAKEMFPRIGQSEEANLAMNEYLRHTIDLAEARQKAYDQLSDEFLQTRGRIPGNIGKLVQERVQDEAEKLTNRTAYRTRELYEREKGKTGMKKLASKKVPKGTPLTPQMYTVLLEKYKTPEKTIENAKKLGYKIYDPEKIEEFSYYAR